MRLRPLRAITVPSPVLGHRAGRWYVGPLHVADASSYIVAGDTLLAQPFYVPARRTYDRIAVNATAAESGKSVRLGIYRHDYANVVPGALALDAGAVSVAVEGKREIVISQALSAGWWWLALLSDATGAARLAASGTVGGNAMLGYDDADTTAFHRYVTRSQAYGALPDPFGAVSSYVVSVVTPRVWLRA